MIDLDRSAKRALVEHTLGCDVSDWIRTARADGATWPTIQRRLADHAGPHAWCDVRTLRRWAEQGEP